MIGSLCGKLIACSGNQFLIDVSGVGYEVTVSGAVLSRNDRQGHELSLFVYTDVKENAIVLYGFRDTLEKQVFLLLRKVKGIGSRLALNIISAIGAVELLSNIGRSDVAALQRVPGIGKKTAQRLIVELRENVGKMVQGAGSPAADDEVTWEMLAGDAARGGSPGQDACLALAKLGFAADVAERAVREAELEWRKDSTEPLDASELLRKALTKL